MIVEDVVKQPLSPFIAEPPPRSDGVTFNQSFDASMFTENDVQNVLRYKEYKSFPPDPTFDLVKSLESRNLWDDRDMYLGSRSESEVDYRSSRIAEERKQRDIVQRAGWMGVATDMLAGNLSPTIFLPFLKGKTVGQAALGGALLLGASSVAQEAVLFTNQYTRTPEQSGINIGAATILGGLLGGIAKGLSPKELDAIADDMVNIPDRETISEPTPFMMEHEAAGADVPGGGAGKLKSNRATKPILDKLAFLGPITRGIQQTNAPSHMPQGSPVLREATQKFGQGGLRLEGNVEGKVAIEGGNVENMIKTYAGPLDEANRAIDRSFREYVYAGQQQPKVAPQVQAWVKAKLNKELMDYAEFKRQVSIAQWRNYDHPNSFVVQAAKEADKHIQSMYDDAVEVKIFTGEEKPEGDKRYLSHLWDSTSINSGMNRLINIFAEHYEPKLNTKFREGLEKLREKQRKGGQFINDAERTDEEVAALTEQFKKELQDLEDSLSFENAQVQLEVTNLREKARKAEGKDKGPLLERARELEASFSPELKSQRLAKGELRSRLRNLSTARVSVDARLQSKLEKIDRNEELQVETMLRAAKAAQKLLALIGKGSDKEVAAELSKFKSLFAKSVEAFDNAEEKIVRLTEARDERVSAVIDAQTARADRLDDIAVKIEEIEDFDRAALAAEVEDAAREMLQVHADINAKRVLRNQRLEASLKRLTPEEFQARLDAKKAKLAELEPAFKERMRVAGADTLDLEKGVADFKKYVRDISAEVVHKLRGTERRLAYSDIVQDKRGVELARVLDIPAEKVLDYLETDIEKVLAVYTRTLAADISLARAFGTSNMEETFAKLTDEQTKAVEAIKGLKDKKGQPLSKKAMADLEFKTNKFYDEGRADLYVLQERARGTRGLPKDPNSASARMAKTALELNGLRYLGGVVVASVQDPARMVQRHGLLRTFRHGFIPLVTNFANLKLAAREARLAGTANDMVIHTRLNTFNDVFDDAYRGTYLERGIHYASNQMGTIAGFNQWTQAWKSVASGVVNARLTDAISIVAGAERASAKDLQRATEYLASVNITSDLAETMWKEISNSLGGAKVRGTWLPNTESWDITKPQVKRALRAYRAALAGEIDDTIVTPGLERPNWIDSGFLGRMLGQFKSFGLSSTQKTLMAGIQQHDAAYLNGMLISLSLGALSYYLYATAVGGDTEAKMLKSIEDGNWERWADEAISRSGQTAIFDSVQRIANRVPVMNKYASFSGGPISKIHGGGMVNELGGPTLDLIAKMTGLAQGLPDPDRRTLHTARQLMPFQNLFYLRRLLDQVENAGGDTLGLEGKRQ